MLLGIYFDIIFMRKLFIDLKHLILNFWKNYLLALDIFYKFMVIVEYISHNRLFIYLVRLWLITESKELNLKSKWFDEISEARYLCK